MTRRPAPRQRIRLVEHLWAIERRRLLGELSPTAYRQAVIAARRQAAEPRPCPPRPTVPGAAHD